MTVAEVGQSMYETAPARDYYPLYLTNEEIIGNFYENVLGRQGDAEGIAFWTAELDAGRSAGDVIKDMITAVNNYDGTDAAALESKALFQNKVVVAEYYATQTSDGIDGATAAIANVTADSDVSTDAAIEEIINSSVVTGDTFTLTASVDDITGTDGNDSIAATNATLTSLDTIDGGAGTDSMAIVSSTQDLNGDGDTGDANEASFDTANITGLSVSNVETVNLRAAHDATLDTSSWSGVETVNATQVAGNAAITAATSSAINVSGVTGTIGVDGGSDVSVTDSTAGQDITVGATTVNSGTVSVTDSNVGNATVAIDGGTDVTVDATGSTAGSAITVGQGAAATDLPSGEVAVSSAHKAVAATDASLANVTVDGGSSVTVNQTAESSLAAGDKTGSTVTQGDVTITGSTSTTTVNVSQTASNAEVLAKDAVAAKAETATVTFKAMTTGQTLILDADGSGGATAGDLTFEAAKDLTAQEVAAAFADLMNPDTQGDSAASNGTYTLNGTADTDLMTAWTSSAADGDTVTFTSTNAGPVTDLAFAGTATAPTVKTSDGVSEVKAVTGELGVINGTVVIDDNATSASITTVDVDGYGDTSTIGATNTLSALQSLSLANSGGTLAGDTDAGMTVDAAGVASLDLTVNNIQGGVSLDGAADNALKTLNLSGTGSSSKMALTAASVETMNVSGDQAIDLTAGTLTGIKSVAVSDTAGLTLDADEADTLTSVDTSATSGTVTAHIKGAQATYTGGAGVDNVTLNTDTALTKAIDLGAGDDTLSFDALAVTGSSAALSGGDGADTMSMSIAAADGLDGSVQSFYTNFEQLTLNDKLGTADAIDDSVTVNLANLGFTNYVTTSGTQVSGVGGATVTDTLTLSGLASNATVALTAQGSVVANVANAASGTADVLNVALNSAGDLTAGTLTAADVETVNISSTDTETGANPTANANSLTLTADKATAVNVSGGNDLDLTLTGSTSVTSIDGSAMSGDLTVTSLNTSAATTITGGSGDDALTAAAGTTADVLIGGAGDDTLDANQGMTTMTGGEGRDTFVIDNAPLNVNSYSTIEDFTSDDLIQFTGADSFQAAEVTLGSTAVFQDFANAAINGVGANDLAWFDYEGNTYVVHDAGADSTAFDEGNDMIVKLTGVVDLSGASFNDTTDTISIA
jgi:S-layer protein